MQYFKRLQSILAQEKDEDYRIYKQSIEATSIAHRIENGLLWYPIVIKGTESAYADYLVVEIERVKSLETQHQFRFGSSVTLFSNHDAKNNKLDGVVVYQGGNKMRIHFKTEELPDWADDGKLGVQVLFDDYSYSEMERALELAQKPISPQQAHLIAVLTGEKDATIINEPDFVVSSELNTMQNNAVATMITAQEVALVHGPPGTGKTTTLVKGIETLAKKGNKILVTAPSNTAVDLLSEKLSNIGLNVVRIGNPARVSPTLTALTLDDRKDAHASTKDIKRLKKQANEFRNMAHKYKRNFGKAEREQRRALFTEAHKILKETESIEQYIVNDIITKADVITATLVGAAHNTIRDVQYDIVVIDEAGQALEPACWIPILKAKKVILAGDHLQLPPTIKSQEAAKQGLATTLFEQLVTRHPNAVTMLNTQYRMHHHIMQFSSDEFYNGQLVADVSVATALLSGTNTAVTFIDTAGCGYEEKQEGTSIVNAEEAQLLFSYLSSFIDNFSMSNDASTMPSIGIIAPYKEQVVLLKEMLQNFPMLSSYSPSININTVDAFQGQERDIICISLVRSNADGMVGFLADTRRMNVAMTRAKKQLIMIGDSATLSQHPFYAKLIVHTEDNNHYHSAWEYLT